MQRRKSNLLLTVVAVILLGMFPLAEHSLDPYTLRILKLIAVNIILGQAVNLVNGITGLFSLGHSGFALIGAYTFALLTTPISKKVDAWILTPLIWPFNSIEWHFVPSLICAGLVAGILGFLVGIPALRFRGDYLAIATLAFAEIAMLRAFNLVPLTNGPLGIKAVPEHLNTWWIWGLTILAVVFVSRLSQSAFGRALKCIRQDERAAELMGVNLFYHKVIAFSIGAVIEGVAGAMIASFFTSVDPLQFSFVLTFA